MPSPFATLKAVSGVAVSIADSAVVADVRSPIACVKAVVAAFPTPIGGRPEHARGRWPHPGSGGPEVTARPVCPVAGGPHIAGAGTDRLGVDGYRRGGDIDGHDERHCGVGNLR